MSLVYNKTTYLYNASTKNEESYKDTPLYKSTHDWENDYYIPIDGRYHCNRSPILNNTEGLGTVYNRIIDEITSPIVSLPDEYKEKQIYIFMHDDVQINETKESFLTKLIEGFKKFDILGLAGTSSWTLKSPAVWNNSDKTKWSGAVRHAHDGKEWMTNFGPIGNKCIILDGLFLAMKQNVLEKVKFDEQFKFHHYDMDFCLSAHKAGFTMGTVPIDVTHHSIGDWTKDPLWYESANLFVNKWTPKS